MKSKREQSRSSGVRGGGLSANVSFGGSVMQNRQATVSCRPNPVKSPTSSVCSVGKAARHVGFFCFIKTRRLRKKFH